MYNLFNHLCKLCYHLHKLFNHLYKLCNHCADYAIIYTNYAIIYTYYAIIVQTMQSIVQMWGLLLIRWSARLNYTASYRYILNDIKKPGWWVHVLCFQYLQHFMTTTIKKPVTLMLHINLFLDLIFKDCALYCLSRKL